MPKPIRVYEVVGGWVVAARHPCWTLTYRFATWRDAIRMMTLIASNQYPVRELDARARLMNRRRPF